MRSTSRVLAGLLAVMLSGACNCGGHHGPGGLTQSDGIPTTVSQVNFGNVQVGQTVRLKLLLSNTGAGPLGIDQQAVNGPPFSETSKLIGSLAPGGRSTATLAFTPTVAGPATGTFTIDDDGAPSSVLVALAGNGIDLNLTVAPSSLDFGPVPVGTSPSPARTVTFTNTNAEPVYLALSAAITAPEYMVTDPTGAPVGGPPVALQPNVPYVVTVTFSPDTASIFNSSFSYTVCEDAASSTCLPAQTVPLTGQGVTATLALSPNPIQLNSVPAGSSAQQAVTVTNNGTADATVTCLYFQSLGNTACGTATSVFSLGAPSTALPATLTASGGSLTVVLTYSAASASGATDTLAADYTTAAAGPVATATDPIQASAAAAPCQITISPASLAFTQVAVGSPITEDVNLGNAGGSDCTVNGIAIDGSSDPSYALAAGQPTSLTLPAGTDAGVGITFTLNNDNPPASRLGKLDFSSNDTAHASVQVPLVATLASPYAGGGAWPRWHHDNTQSGLSPNDTSGLAGTIAWTVNVGAPPGASEDEFQEDYLNSPVVGSDGTVYQMGMDGNLYAVDSAGLVQWKAALQDPTSDPHPSTPIVVKDGTIFVAFGEVQSNAFFHVSAAGQVLSSIPPEGGGDGFDLPPIVTNGGLLIGADDLAGNDGNGGAFAYSISGSSNFNLSVTATFPNVTAANDQMSAVVGLDDTTYWCAGMDCDALSPPGSGFALLPAWQNGISAFNNNQSVTSDLALDVAFTGNLMILLSGMPNGDGSGFFGLGGSGVEPQMLYSINPQTAAVVWSDTLPAPTNAQQDDNFYGVGDATAGNSCPAIGTDGTVYVGNFDGLHAVDGATGAEKPGFPFLTNADDVLTAPAIGGDGTIFFGTAAGTFYAIHPDGTLRFKVNAGGRISGSPAIGPSGAVYFTADDGYLYAVQ